VKREAAKLAAKVALKAASKTKFRIAFSPQFDEGGARRFAAKPNLAPPCCEYYLGGGGLQCGKGDRYSNRECVNHGRPVADGHGC
jgi:hypothetical protein